MQVLPPEVYAFIESIRLALDAVPSNIKIEEVKSVISRIKGVIDFHDLHLWALSTSENALSAHVVIKPDSNNTLNKLQIALADKFNIKHITIQLEEKNDNLNCSEC